MSVQAEVTSSMEDRAKCEICNKVFSKKNGLNRHVLAVHIGKREKCDICHQTFTAAFDLRRHDLKFHGGRLVAEKALRDAQKLSSKREYKCEICQKSFKWPLSLRRHMSFLHQDQDSRVDHRCSLCSKYYTGSFEQHADKHHGNLHRCMVCDKVCRNPGVMKDHMTVHTGKRSYVCRKCGNSYSSSNSLYLHQRLHEEKIPCKQCGKLFLSIRMPLHLISHSDKRPYQCEICGKGFKKPANLDTHKKSHSSVRPHSCDVCGSSFKLPHQLRAHKKRH